MVQFYATPFFIWARSSVWESVRFASVRSRVRSPSGPPQKRKAPASAGVFLFTSASYFRVFLLLEADHGIIISGTFFLCAAPPDSNNFAGLTDQQVKTYLERFATPEMFLNAGGDLFVLPYL